jgi:rare lipoprotein A
LAYSWANLPNIDGEKASGLDASSQESSKISLPPQIMQVLNNLFRWQDYFVHKPKPTPAAVVVARSDTLMPPQTRRNFWLFSQNSPENVFSDAQQSPGAPIVSATPKFQVWLKRHLIAEFEQKLDADLLAQRLQQLVSNPNLDAQQLLPGLVNGEPAIKLGDRLLFLVDDALKASIRTNKDLIAVKLTNSIRLALGVTALDLAQAQTTMYRLSETSNKITGLASWYGSYFHGRQTANGEIYDQNALTVAHPSLPFDTHLKVTNQKNNKSVIVRVNDRGPYVAPRVLDLSTIAARCIGSEDTGVVLVDAVIMEPMRERK